MERQGLRSHLSGTVPISIALHLVAIMIVLIIPLTAVDLSLAVYRPLPDYIRAVPMPPPPAVAIRRAPLPAAVDAPRPETFTAPTSAPSEIAPERDRPAFVSSDAVPDLGAVSTGAVGIARMGQQRIVAPPPPPKPTGPVRAAELPVAPRKIADARPVYPDAARQARQEGTVVLEAVLDPTGSVTHLRVVQSVPLLDQAALDAVRRWKYTPTIYAGHPVSVLMTITIRFTLQH